MTLPVPLSFLIFLLWTALWPLVLAQSTPPAQQSPQNRENLFAETYKIKIMGVIESKDPRKSVALIKDLSTRKVSAIKAGYLLKGRYPVLSISQDSVHIKDQSKYVVLHKNRFFAKTADNSSGQNSSTTGTPQVFSEDGLLRKTQDDAISVRLSSAYRDHMIQKDLQTILMQAAATPVTESGKITGFVLTDITPGSIYEKAGFLNGDIITTINSSPLSSASGAIKILNGLKKETEVEVTITRENTPMHMMISIQ